MSVQDEARILGEYQKALLDQDIPDEVVRQLVVQKAKDLSYHFMDAPLTDETPNNNPKDPEPVAEVRELFDDLKHFLEGIFRS